METISIGNRAIGGGNPAFIVAEVGINHNGDFELAKQSIAAAAEAGADAVKFQNYRTEDFLADDTLTYTYVSQGKKVTESQWNMFKRCEPKAGWVTRLKEFCDEHRIIFFSTPTSEAGVNELVENRIPLIKNGSDYITHLPLLEHMARTGIPVVISTGMANQQDIDDAVAAIRLGTSPLVLLHCTSAYPTPPNEVNLRRMLALRDRYRVPVGFSDHTEGWRAAAEAVALGACLVEKHFTLDHNLAGPDHRFSSTPAEFAELVREIRLCEKMLGSANLLPAEVEAEARREYRLSAQAVADLAIDTRVAWDQIVFRRPGTGILPRDMHGFIGRRLRRAVARGCPLQRTDFVD